jgi:hypothetical protein
MLVMANLDSKLIKISRVHLLYVSGIVDVFLPDHSAIRRSKVILARSCEAGRGDFSRTIRAIGNAVTMKELYEGKRFSSQSGAASTPPECSAA